MKKKCFAAFVTLAMLLSLLPTVALCVEGTSPPAHSDSSTTTVTDKETGAIIVTTKYPDGSIVETVTMKDGTQTIDVTLPQGAARTTVTIPTLERPAPDVVAFIVRRDGSREVVKTSVSSEKGLRVTLTESAQLELGNNSKAFEDVTPGSWYATPVSFVSSRELLSGVGSSLFAPEEPTTRAMVWTVLARLTGVDLTGGTWYEKAQLWATEAGISDGTNPAGNLNREQLVTMLWRYAGSPKGEGDLSAFSDSGTVSSFAKDATLWAVSLGLIEGSGGRLLPQDSAQRNQVAAILHRFLAPPVGARIVPLPSSLEASSLTDATVAASFEAKNLVTASAGVHSLFLTVFDYELFDLVDISMLAVGDTIVVAKKDIQVKTLEKTEGGLVVVNGGIENGGVALYTEGNTVYFEVGMNGAKNYFEVGQAPFTIGDNFKFIDSSDLDHPGREFTYDAFAKKLERGEINCNQFNTSVLILDGDIVEITLNYLP